MAVISPQNEKKGEKDVEVRLFSLILHKLLKHKMKKSIFTAIFLAAWCPLSLWATVDPTATYNDSKGNEITASAQKDEKVEGDAPLLVRFAANASDLEAGSTLEWHFRHYEAQVVTSEITRYEDNPEFTFMEAGRNVAMLYVRTGYEVVDSASFEVTVNTSHLEMPNAFSPNDDGHNDIYGAKGACHPEASGRYRSIVEFHGYIFNRWGQKLFEWTDISKGWDGTYNGSPCKDGVYYVLVKARGADGIEYNIRRDVNLIRDRNTVTSSTTGGSNQ